MISIIFVVAAFVQLRDLRSFALLGYPAWFGAGIAVAELVAAAALWMERYARIAAFGLILIMFGAIYTHMHVGDPRGGILPAVLLFGLVRLAGVRK